MYFEIGQNNQSPKEIKSVTIFDIEGEYSTSYHRIRGPFSYLNVEILDGVENGIIDAEAIMKGDLVIIQPEFPKELVLYEEVKDLAKEYCKPIVFVLDNLFFDSPEILEIKKEETTKSKLPILQCLMESDWVIVPTQNLKEKIKFLNKNIIVLPHFLDEKIWPLIPPKRKIRNTNIVHLGFFGKEADRKNLKSILPVLEKIILKHPNIKITFLGAKPPGELGKNSQVNWISVIPENYNELSSFLSNQEVDIFIDPLVSNEFNQSASPLKFLEISSLGVPGVYSNIDSYGIIQNGITGFLAENEEQWEEYLIELIENNQLRYEIAENAQQAIRENWLLSTNIHLWKNQLNKIYNRVGYKESTNNQLLQVIQKINNQNFSLLTTKTNEIKSLTQELNLSKIELNKIKTSPEWRLSFYFRKLFEKIIPKNSLRRSFFRDLFYFSIGQRTKIRSKKLRFSKISIIDTSSIKINSNNLQKHKESIDIIVCVHNALEDVKNCLDSLLKYSTNPYSIIIVDDGSDENTKNYLELFARNNDQVSLLRNNDAKGYTRAANIGLHNSLSPIKVLLNSDTVVGPEWLDRMYRAIKSDDKIGVAGPLSNTASWQSIPELAYDGDWATNPLPNSITVEKMSRIISKYSGCIYPEVPLLNGFCLMIKKEVIEDIGYLDEENFGQGYGEEDDFNIRAGKAGWKKIIVDDVYVFHAQSKSYSHETRYKLSNQNSKKLAKKHGVNNIAIYVKQMNPNRIMEGVRHRSNILLKREEIIFSGYKNFKNKKILFVLPVMDAGGGANIIIDESRAMRKMGVDVQIFNFKEYKSGFSQSYPQLDVPVTYGKKEDLESLGKSFDAVVASAYYSVDWLLPLTNNENNLILGYYIQDYEPMMFPIGSDESEKAKASYILINNLKCFTKTNWNAETLLKETGVKASVVGKSVNIDLYRPRKSIEYGIKPVTVVAMIRPSSPYRNPEFTLSVLKEISKKFGKNVDIWLFGTHDLRDSYPSELLNFKWRQLGKLNQYQVASLLSHADIFTDFSVYQAMGLTSLEAMACGCSVIVPQMGGSKEFVHHFKNGMVVDTSNFGDCFESLEELIQNDNLRIELQITGSKDVVNYFPERAAYNILKSIFDI